MLSIPLKADAGGGAGADYETTIDSYYDLYTTQLKNYPVANATEFETGKFSQEFWGLQLTSRASQNTSFQSSLSLGAASGTGNLTLYSRTASFTKDIKQAIAGNIKTGIFLNQTFDFTRNQKTTFVATSGVNKFLINSTGDQISVASCSSSYEPTEDWVNTTIDTPDLGNSVSTGKVYIAAVKGDKIWVWYNANHIGTGDFNARVKMRGSLYTIGSSGTLTLVGHGTIYDSGASTNAWHIPANYKLFGTYTYNGTAYFYSQGLNRSDSGTATYCKTLRIFGAIDLSVTASFSVTIRHNQNSQLLTFIEGGNQNDEISVAFDNSTDTMYYITALNDIYSQVTTSAPSDTTQNGYSSSFDEVYLLKTYDYLRLGTGIYTNGNNIVNQSGNVAGLPTQTQRDNSFHIYEITTLTEETNNIYKTSGINGGFNWEIGLNSVSNIYKSLDLVLYINTVEFERVEVSSFSSTGSILKDFILSQTSINAKYIQFDLKTENNSGGLDHKIAFAITGGTYATPTFNYEVSELNVLL